MVGSQRRILLDILMVFWGYGSWLGVNGVFVQLPLLVERLPEGWALPSSITVAIQLGNSGLIAYAILRRLLPRASDTPYIYILLVILTTSLYLNSFLYTKTAMIGGSVRSIAFLALTFGLALVGCTSSVLFYPYLRHFKDVYLATYLVGEGLSGFIPSVLSLIQGIGENPQCIYSPDNKTVEVVFPPTRFDTNIFLVILGSLGLLSLVSFALIDNLKTFLSERVQPLQEEKDEKGEERSREPFVVWQRSFIGVLFLLACLNALMNGVLPSVQSYSCMPYGRNIYHLSNTLGAMVNPMACLAGVWLKPAPSRLLAGMLFSILLPLCYILSTAVLSPTPPLYTQTGGKVLIVLAWITVLGVVSYARMWIYGFARRGGGTGMRVCGAAGQVGSALGSLTLYLIVNFSNVFTQLETCPLPASSI